VEAVSADMETLFHDHAREAARRQTEEALARGDKPVEMSELRSLWDELRARSECWNGMTDHYLRERYGERVYHVMGVGWFVRPEGSTS
jgi:hypothetical protein